MLTITPRQYQALAAAADQGFVAVVAQHLATRGAPLAVAGTVAAHAFAAARERGLAALDDVQALAEVLLWAGSAQAEPGWSVEITRGTAPDRARRLRSCLAALQGAR